MMMMVVMMIKVAKSLSVIMAHINQLTSVFYILMLIRGIFKVHIFLNGRRRHDLPVHKKTHIKAEQSTILPPLTNSS